MKFYLKKQIIMVLEASQMIGSDPVYVIDLSLSLSIVFNSD